MKHVRYIAIALALAFSAVAYAQSGSSTEFNSLKSGPINSVGNSSFGALSTPSIVGVVPAAPGSTAWGYKVVARIGSNTTAASPEVRTTVGSATLTSGTANTVVWNQVLGADVYDVYRTTVGASPTTTGLIGTVDSNTLSFVDTGLAGDSSTPPSVNTTGVVVGLTFDASLYRISGSPLAFSNLAGVISTSQEPSTTVNSVTGETNIGASITGQNLTLTWLSTLADARLAGSYSGVGNCPTHQVVSTTSRNTPPGCIQLQYSDIGGTPPSAANTPAIAHQWLNSFNSSLGTFGQSQPAASDLTNGTTGSGLVMLNQSPVSTNQTINQAANGNDAFLSKRFTDTSPTGNFIRLQNSAGSTDLYKVDVSGNVTSTSQSTGSINGVIYASKQSGATADVQISNAIAALPSGTGTVMADYSSNQTWNSCPTWGSGQVTLDLSGVSYSIVPTCVIPRNVTLKFRRGALIAPASSSVQVNIDGPVEAQPTQKLVDITNGTVVFDGVPVVWWDWYGAADILYKSSSDAEIQAGLNAMSHVHFIPSNTGNNKPIFACVGSSTYVIHNRPLFIHMSNLVFGGLSGGQTSCGVKENYGAGPSIYVGPGPSQSYCANGASTCAQAVTLVTGITSSGGNSLSFDPAHPNYWFNASMDTKEFLGLNGASALTWEAYYNPTALSGSRVLMGSSGGRTGTEGVTQAFQMQLVGNIPVCKITTSGSGAVQVAAGTVTVGTTSHIACSWDGSTLRAFVGGNLGGSIAATGTLVKKDFEDITLGPALSSWPDNGVLTNAAAGAVDSPRISNNARYTAAFTPPTAKLTSDGNTLFLMNFDNCVDVVCNFQSKDTGGFIFLRNNTFVGAINNIEIQNMFISTGTQEGGGLVTYQTNRWAQHDLNVNLCAGALDYFWNNAFIGHGSDIFIDAGCSGTSPISGHSMIGLAMVGATGVEEFENLNVTGGVYQIVGNGLSGSFNRTYLAPNNDTIGGFFFKGAGGSERVELTHPLCDAEVGTTSSYVYCMFVSNMRGISLLGGELESTTQSPLIVDQGDTVNIIGTRFLHTFSNPAQEIHILSPPTRPINLWNAVQASAQFGTVIPWCDTTDSCATINNGFNTAAFSATPTFDCSLNNNWKMTLTGNVTSSTLSNCTKGTRLTFTLCQDGTGSRTFAWPSNVLGGGAINSTASVCSSQIFLYEGPNARALGLMVSDNVAASGEVLSVTNDANITGSILNNNLAFAWAGTLAKNRNLASAVYTDQSNTFGAFLQRFQAGNNFNFVDPTDVTKIAKLDLSNITPGQTRSVNVPDANSTLAQSIAATTNQFLTGMSAQGVFSAARPACANLSDAAASCSTDTTVANNISSGTLPSARLPNPSSSSLGGVQSLTAVTSKWINAISTTGVPSATQPAFTDISGSLAAAQTPAYTGDASSAAGSTVLTLATVVTPGTNTKITYNAKGLVTAGAQAQFSDIGGTVASSQLPNPSPTTLGGIESFAAVTHQWINSISTSGVPSASQPASSDLSDVASLSLKPASSDNIQFVSNNGNDSNDGRSWGSAKLTCTAALTTLGSSAGYLYIAPPVGSDCIAATNSATGLNGYIWAPTQFYIGPLGQATSGTTGFDSRKIHLVGSVWKTTGTPAAADDAWDIYVNDPAGSFANGSNLIISHSSISSGAGRALFLADMVEGNPRTATSSLNSNSFAFDNQSAYWETASGGSSQTMLWEMANTINADGSGSFPYTFRQNWVPIFSSACSGCSAEFALGGSGSLGVSGNYSGNPKWLFTGLNGSFNTATFTHNFTAPHTITAVDADSNTLRPLTSPGSDHKWVQYVDNTGLQNRTQPASADISDGTGTGVVARQTSPAFSGTPTFPDGTVSAPGIGLASEATGFYKNASGDFRVTVAGVDSFRVQNTDVTIPAGKPLRWGSAGVTSADTSLSRGAAGEVDCGNGSQGDKTCTFKASIIDASTGFSISGAATSGHVLRGNGTRFVDSALGFSDLSGAATPSQLPVLVASGSSHAAGIAPDPGSTVGTTRFLREDSTWVDPSSTISWAINAQTGTSYTIASSDRGKLITASNSAATSYTLPQAGGSFPAGWFTDIQNINSGVVTITPTTSTINGAATFTLNKNQSVTVVSDGTNYQIEAGMKPVKFTAVSHQFLTSVDDFGLFSAAQPAFTDISGSAACGQIPALTSDVTTTAGSCATTVSSIQGTTVSGTSGTGNVAFTTSPVFTTPTLGVASATELDTSKLTLDSTNKDAIITRAAAATFQLGGANAASPVNQTLQAQGSRSGTDTNVSGANLTIASGQGTGNSTASNIIFQTPVAGSSGTGAETMTTQLTILPSLIRLPSANVLQFSTDTGLCRAAAGNIKAGNGTACDGTGTLTAQSFTTTGNGIGNNFTIPSIVTITGVAPEEKVSADFNIGWTNAVGNNASAKDVGVGRDSAAILQVHNSVSGRYAGLKSGEHAITGSITAAALGTPSAPTITNGGTAGSTSYSYAVVAKTITGNTAASATGSTATGNATLTSSNFNTVTWTAVVGALSYDVYRVSSSGSPSTVGFIANVAPPSLTTNDTGLAGDGRTAPTVNTTGGFQAVNGVANNINGSAAVNGSITLTQLSTPSAPFVAKANGSGSSTWGYKIIATDGVGNTLASSETTVGSQNATLSGSASNTVQWLPVLGAVTYKVFRSTVATSPSTTGVIATLNAPTLTFTDTGAAGDSTSVPANNTTGQILLTNGSASVPSQAWVSETNSGPYRAGSGDFRWSVGGSDHFRIEAGDVTLASADFLRWGSSGVTSSDTFVSRCSGGVLALGTSQTACNAGGAWEAAGYISASTTFTTNAGCTEDTLVGGATAGKFVSHTTGSCTVVVTMGSSVTAPHGWACGVSDRTTANLWRQTNDSTTTASLTGVSSAGDTISFTCTGY